MGQKKTVKSGDFVSLGQGEVTQLVYDIAKKLNQTEKIMREKKMKDTATGETKTVSVISPSGKKAVMEEFFNIIDETGYNFMFSWLRTLYGPASKPSDNETIKMAMEHMFPDISDFIPNHATSKMLYQKLNQST